MECTQKGVSCGFHCTGSDESETWKKIHALPKEMGCEECADHASFEFRGLHDHVGVGLGKPPYNKSDYNRWVEEVVCVHDKCIERGEC